jgi:hypothetical protein
VAAVGYLVRPSGRLSLPVADEPAAVRAATASFAGRGGWFGTGDDGDTLADIAWVGTATVTRDGDWIDFGDDDDNDPKWSDQATAFYVAIAPFVRAGTVRFQGEDGAEWSYTYAGGRVTQDGWNGWDGSVEPFGESTTP